MMTIIPYVMGIRTGEKVIVLDNPTTYGFKEGIRAILPILGIIVVIAFIHALISRILVKNKKELLAIFLGTVLSKTIGVLFVLLLNHVFYDLIADGVSLILFFSLTIALEGLINTFMIKTDRKSEGLVLSLICNLVTCFLSFYLLERSLNLFYDSYKLNWNHNIFRKIDS